MVTPWRTSDPHTRCVLYASRTGSMANTRITRLVYDVALVQNGQYLAHHHHKNINVHMEAQTLST
jgi:sensor c-di-GMP phosphodiesterase-like protein